MAIGTLEELSPKKVKRILDVGYGGGTFIPALSQLTRHVYGIDLHDKMKVVHKILRKERIRAVLSKDSIFKTKFPERFFDRVVCISVLEHFRGKELDRACREMKRILVPGGYIILGFPTKNSISNFIIRHILKFTPDEIHPSGHTEILAAVKKTFHNCHVSVYPSFLPMHLALYVMVHAKKSWGS